MLWDNGGRFDRRTFQWNDPELYNMIMASLKGRSSTGESDLIFIKKGAPAQDAVIHLNLNGNSFDWHQKRRLRIELRQGL